MHISQRPKHGIILSDLYSRRTEGVVVIFKPANKTSLYQEVIRQIVKAIKSGKWKPGMRVPPEAELAELFQVGRNSIREATKALAILGVIEARPGYGTLVCDDALSKIHTTELLSYMRDKSSWLELMQVRLLLEVQIASWAAERATEDDIRGLMDFVGSYREKAEEGVYPRNAVFFKENADFHEMIADIAGNRLAIQLLRSIRSELDAQRHAYLELPPRNWNRMVEEHVEIAEHIKNHRSEEAAEAMRKHLSQAIRDLGEPGPN